MKTVERFHALDSFRGVCAIFVVIYHMRLSGSFTEIQFFRNSHLFVEFFFVLSGFVLTYTYGQQKTLDLKRFLISRTFRLFPLHIFMLAVFIFLEFGKLIAYKSGIKLNNEPFTGNTAAFEIIPNLLLIQSWTNLTKSVSFNSPSWSISVEYYMYIVFGLILFYAFPLRKIAWSGISIVSFTLIYLNINVPTNHSQSGLSCFFAGALSCTIYQLVAKKITPHFWKATLFEITAVISVVIALNLEFVNKKIIVSILFCFVIIIFAFDQGLISKILKEPFFNRLGALSYSIYLTHAAVLFLSISAFIIAQKITGLPLAPMIDGKRTLDTGNYLLNNLVGMTILIIIIFLSTFTYHYIEISGQDFGKKLNRKMPT